MLNVLSVVDFSDHLHVRLCVCRGKVFRAVDLVIFPFVTMTVCDGLAADGSWVAS